MYKKTPTRFTKQIRISQENLKWLNEKKDTKTIAGFLDKILNERKQYVPAQAEKGKYVDNSTLQSNHVVE